jgi:molybdopterin/thiamine biosynthesis adenylyltransferase/rhodanese-related sulfurtransferase
MSSERQVDPRSASDRLAAGAWLIDIREPQEWAAGVPAGARTIAAGDLVATLAREAVPHNQCLLLICASGMRSAALLERVAAAGWPQVASVDGGLRAWRAAGLPVEVDGGLGAVDAERYARHLVLPGVGPEGQRRLAAANVLVVGAGGLGSPVLLYLAAAGIGRITVVDDDRVDLTNLQRQVVHDSAAIGRPKVESAAARLRALNPGVAITPVAARFDAANAGALVAAADVVIDGSDNLATRYLVNATCVRAGKPWVYAAIERFAGQAAVFWPAAPGGPWPCYRCLFPVAPGSDWVPGCAEAGVLGVLPGLMGSIQATEAIKLILGIGEPLLGRLLHVDALAMRFREARLAADPECPDCGALAVRVASADNARS